MNVDEKRIEELNVLYKEHASDLESIHSALKREMPLLVQEHQLSLEQTAALDEYINDRVTIFRYLRKNDFSRPHTLSRMLDTLKWRIHKNMGLVTVEDQDPAFFEGPFCFFHGHDRVGRPVILVQLSHYPAFNGDAAALLSPFIAFVFETARRVTLETSMDRLEKGEKNPIITETVLLIDFKKAKSLPRDRKIAGTFIKLVRRYPSSMGSACLLNFGWMYQGLWQMVKLLLTEEAKSRVSFPKVAELSRMIDQPDLIAALEGPDPVPWDWSQDTTFPRQQQQQQQPTLSRSSSSSSIYFDAELYTPEMAQNPPYEDKPGLHTTPSGTSQTTSQTDPALHQNKQKKTDYKHLTSSTTTTTTDAAAAASNRRTIRPSLPPAAGRQVSSQLLQWLVKFERLVLRGLRKVVEYRTTFFWVLACIILRGSILKVLQGFLVLLGKLFAKRIQLSDPSSSGIRVLLSLTGTSMGRIMTL